MGADMSKPVVLDQPFEGNAPEQSFPFFEDPYAIVIDRDPRDLYLEYKFNNHPDIKFGPRTTVDDFIVYYRNMRKKVKKHDRVLRMSFEELIYEYDAAVKKLENFLSLGTHKYPKTVFDPAKSINNTQQIRNHSESIEDIKKIEKELSEFLFHFENYPNAKLDGEVFYGTSRKQIRNH